MAGFLIAIPLSLTTGAAISALILRLHWFGLAGWRWVFILQGIPAVLFGIITLFYLTDHPREAGWVGYELRLGGERLYHSGDTDVIPEMDQVAGVDVALLAVSGVYVMTSGNYGQKKRNMRTRDTDIIATAAAATASAETEITEAEVKEKMNVENKSIEEV